MDIEPVLRELEELLPGMNYVVSFDWYRVPARPDATPAQYVADALGPAALVGGVAELTSAAMLADVEQCIRWEGVGGSYPDQAAIRSPRLDALVAAVLAHLEQRAARSAAVWSFWLTAGHPHYPVQWAFAYLLPGPDGAELFIGSSSD